MPLITRRQRGRRAGFTLVELVVVVLLILVFLAVVAPAVAPMLVFANLETSARNLAAFGARAIDHCILARDRFTVRIDLAEQEYWAVRWPKVTDDDEGGGRLIGGGSLFGSREDFIQRLIAGESPGMGGMSDGEMQEQAMAMFAEMELHHRTVLETRARRVLEQDTRRRGEGRLFDERFTLGREADEAEEEVRDPLMRRTRLPEGVRINRVVVGEKSYTGGTVDIEITPVGLARPVSIEIRNDDGDVYTVKWMGNTRQGIVESGWTGPVDEEDAG